MGQKRCGLELRHRPSAWEGISCFRNLLYKGGGKTVRNKNWWQMSLFLDDWWFFWETLRSVMQTLNNTAPYLLRVVWNMRYVLISVSWFSVDTGDQASVWFPRNWRVEKDDYVVFLSFHGESDGRLLTVEML